MAHLSGQARLLTHCLHGEGLQKERKTKGHFVQFGLHIQAGTPAAQFDALIAENEKKGNAFKADTLEALAKKAGMDPARLVHSARMITQYAKAGHDDQFGKDPKFLRRLDKGPFYLVRGKLHALATGNGVKANEFMAVLDPYGRVIERLYVAGELGSMCGPIYQGACNNAESLVFGRRAGRSIL